MEFEVISFWGIVRPFWSLSVESHVGINLEAALLM